MYVHIERTNDTYWDQKVNICLWLQRQNEIQSDKRSETFLVKIS